MTQLLYPQDFPSLGAWASENGISVVEAKLRYAQYCILRSISDSRQLSGCLVLKGGNALDFLWQPNRSTKDLDFSVVDFRLDEAGIRDLLGRTLQATATRTGVDLIIQRIERRPPGEDKTHVTYAVNIGYALPDEPKARQRIKEKGASLNVVPLDISINEEVCDWQDVVIGGANSLRVSVLEDIVAEKLRALLQQEVRNRYRRQDLLDIAVIIQNNKLIDLNKVSEYLLRKCDSKDIVVTKEAFLSEELKNRASKDYAELKTTTRALFVPFEAALSELYRLVDSLQLPSAASLSELHTGT